MASVALDTRPPDGVAREVRARMGAGGVVRSRFPWSFSHSFTILVPAPIRARTCPGLDSGGCASKQAALRLLSTAHPGENRNSIPYL
ncbi:MAG: hypothetical protein HY774_00290 [Acidobacteria bacterium]|nr:hypothetical protein [Acidobacteriota bacterium]